MKEILYDILYITLGSAGGALLSCLMLTVLKQLIPRLDDLFKKIDQKTPKTKVFRGSLFIGIIFTATIVKDFFALGYIGFGLIIGFFVYLKDDIFDSTNGPATKSKIKRA
ncbi:hypothetical protein HYG86_07990 [Alkalicella caledoniensis]|uniref:Uncharacterized protein n=1 Tax=Alkalicella caledoniensis TaxID=2731377 RepID=A0A7G9W7R9_ALKCA|nr:hypothetical protein [Alkalicella caledoniensis]QNO14731.1 hypothetical protein HYG86_07990 [Alkalicella caledoniensis]